MHQAASYIFTLFLSPINWIIILVIAGYFFKKALFKKICSILALCIFLVFGNAWILNWYAKKWQPQPAYPSPGLTYSCGIVAGGFASPGNDEKGYFNAAADRFIQAVKLYKLGEIKHILISGGNGKVTRKNFREGAWVKGELLAIGIPDSAIFIEDKSNNTADNAKYSKQILDSLQLKPPYLLITSAHHEPRALLLFNSAGVPSIPFPSNYLSGKGGNFKFTSLFPEPQVLLDWNAYLKEAAGYIWYSFTRKKVS